MRTAPSVTFAASASPVWHCVVCLLAVVSMAAMTAWLMTGSQHTDRWAGWLAALGLALWAISAVRRQPEGALRWDGQAWSWHDGMSADAVPCRLRVAADFGRWILLRCALPRGRAWVALQQHAGQAAQWHALRCALYAPPVQG